MADVTGKQVKAKLKRARDLHRDGNSSAATSVLEEVLEAQPDNAEALQLMGDIATQSGSPGRAVSLLEKATALEPDNAAIHASLGKACKTAGRLDRALASFERSVALDPEYVEAHYQRGNSLLGLQKPESAIRSYDRVLDLEPRHVGAHLNRGTALLELGHAKAAVECYDRALAIRPRHAGALLNRGTALLKLKQPEAAIECYDRALAINRDYAEAHFSRGNALLEMKRPDQAIASYDRALAINPRSADVHYNRGIALLEMKRPKHAAASFDRALVINPDYAAAHLNRGMALEEMNRQNEAMNAYRRALEVNPDFARAHYILGHALRNQKEFDAAIMSYEKAFALQPDLGYLEGTLLHTRMKACAWDGFESRRSDLFEKIRRRQKVSPAFPVLSLTDQLEIQRKAAEIWTSNEHPANHDLGRPEKRPRSEKIRIGYYSADFRDHPVSTLTAGLYEKHDRQRFEVFAFSFGPESRDPIRARLESAFDHFADVRNRSDREIAQLSRQAGIDIAVDLGGLTMDCRPGIFALRAAPVQVSYIGFPATMGAGYIDYIIADRRVVSQNLEHFYSEKVVCLPCFQANDDQRVISDKKIGREGLGLPETGFVYCSFNSNFKITPGMFSGWMRILDQVPGSVLLLLADNRCAAKNLRAEAAQWGMDTDRIIFAGRLPNAEHLARFRVADLFLDTFPYNAGTTLSDALWAGLPAVTRWGEAFASRMAASLLEVIGLPEMVTSSQEDYEALAVELGNNPERAVALRAVVEENRLASPLFDMGFFTLKIEDAYCRMYERLHDGLPPDHISVT